MSPYPIELAERVMQAVNGGMRISEASKTFDVARATIYRWKERLKERGTLQPKVGYQRGHSHKIAGLKEFQDFVDKHSDKNQTEMGNLLGVAQRTVSHWLGKINYTRKKNKRYIKSGVNVNGNASNASLIA